MTTLQLKRFIPVVEHLGSRHFKVTSARLSQKFVSPMLVSFSSSGRSGIGHIRQLVCTSKCSTYSEVCRAGRSTLSFQRSHLRTITLGLPSNSYRLFATTSSLNGDVKDKTRGQYIPPQVDPTSVEDKSKLTLKEVYNRSVAEAQEKVLGKEGRLGFKGLVKKYGVAFGIYYSSLYFGGMVAAFLVLESGIVSETGVVDWLKMTPIADYFDLTKLDPKLGNFAGAVAINEVMELIRFPFAIITIPYIKDAWDRRKASGKPKDKS